MTEQQEVMHAVTYPGHNEPLIAELEEIWCCLELYDKSEKHRTSESLQKTLNNPPQRLPDCGINTRRLDHLNYCWTLSSLSKYIPVIAGGTMVAPGGIVVRNMHGAAVKAETAGQAALECEAARLNCAVNCDKDKSHTSRIIYERS